MAPGASVLWQFSGATHNVVFTRLVPPGPKDLTLLFVLSSAGERA